MDLSGFDAPGFSGDLNAQARQASGGGTAVAAPQAHPSTPHGLMGFLSRIAMPVIQTGADVSNAIGNAEVKAANAFGIHANNGTQTTKQQFGNIPVVGGQIANNTPKQFVGNLAQTAAFAVPGGEAGLVSKVVQGIRAGALAGGGNALANNGSVGQVFKGAVTGGVTGGALGVAAKPAANILGKLIGVGNKGASSTAAAEMAGAGIPATPSIGQKIANGLVAKGQQAEAKTGAYFPGQKIGTNQLSVGDSQKIAQTLQNEGITALGAPERMAQVESKLGQYGQAIDSLTKAHNTSLSTADKAALTDAFKTRLNAEAGSSSSLVQSHAGNFLNEVLQKGDLTALNAYKKSLDNNILNWNRNPLSATPGQQIAAQAMRSTIKDFLNSKVPGLAETNAKYAALSTAHDALANASGKLASIASGGEGLQGRLLSGETAEKGKAALARGVQNVGKALGGTAESPTAPTTVTPTTGVVPAAATEAAPVVAKGANAIEGEVVNPGGAAANAAQNVKSVIGNIAGRPGTQTNAAFTALTPPQGDQQQQQTNPQQLSQMEQQATQAADQANSSANAEQSSQYPEANMLYDIQRDPAHASTYEALYKLMNPTTKPTAAAQNQVLNAQDMLSSLNNFSKTYSQAGGAKGGVIGSLENLIGTTKSRNTLSQGAIDTINQARMDLGAQMAKLVTGSGKPAESVIEHYTNLLPSINDTPDTAKAKMDYIVSQVNDIKANAQSGANNSSTDIQNQLDQILANTGGQ